MSNNTVQPAIVVFDKDRTEVLGIAPEGTTDITYLSTISEAQVDAGATAGVATNVAGEMIGRSGSNMGKPVGAVVDPVTGVIEILQPDGSKRILPSVENMQSSTPISLTGSTSQKTLIVARIPAEKLFPGCRITADFEFSRNRTGLGSITYGIYLNDYYAKSVGQGEQIISTPSMAAASQDVRREVATVILGADLRHQKFLQNAATSGGMGNLNKYLDCNYNGNKGLAIIVAATLANASDVFTIESYKIEVTK